jgi:hypothetical protein
MATTRSAHKEVRAWPGVSDNLAVVNELDHARSTVNTIACAVEEVVLGVDTHLKTHTAVVIDLVGRQVDAHSFATTKLGTQELIKWARRRGTVRRAGVEGTGSYGIALTRRLQLEAIEVFEVTRPKRKRARHRGKNDLHDAHAAATSVLADGQQLATPKSRDGIVEAIRVLRISRASAVKSRTAAKPRPHRTRGPSRSAARAHDQPARRSLRTLASPRARRRAAGHTPGSALARAPPPGARHRDR